MADPKALAREAHRHLLWAVSKLRFWLPDTSTDETKDRLQEIEVFTAGITDALAPTDTAPSPDLAALRERAVSAALYAASDPAHIPNADHGRHMADRWLSAAIEVKVRAALA